MSKLCLITGSAGFIGHSLVKELSKRGYDVTGLDIRPEKLNTQFLGELDTEVKFVQGDCRQMDQIDHHIEKADIVFHLAGQTDVRSSIKDPLNDFENNVHGSTNVINSCMKNHVKMIFTSSFAVYGNLTTPPIPETADFNPISPYGLSKMMVEQLIGVYRKQYKFNATILRLSNVYGPMDFKSVIYHFLTKCQDSDVINVNGTGEQTRDFCYVDDVVDGIIASTKTTNGTYNIGTGKATSLTRILSIIKDMDGDPLINFRKGLRGDIQHSRADMKHTFGSMLWRPKYDVKEGMKKFDEWLREVRT